MKMRKLAGAAGGGEGVLAGRGTGGVKVESRTVFSKEVRSAGDGEVEEG